MSEETCEQKKRELIENLQNLQSLDAEAAHSEADTLILEYLNDEEIKEAYEAIGKWYA